MEKIQGYHLVITALLLNYQIVPNSGRAEVETNLLLVGVGDRQIWIHDEFLWQPFKE